MGIIRLKPLDKGYGSATSARCDTAFEWDGRCVNNNAKEGSKNVLIVEDDDDIRELLAACLEREGYRVTGAADGREALVRLRSGIRFRTILLDLHMPVMDGWRFREEQKKDPVLSGIPVVVVSASETRENDPEGIAARLNKPIQLEKLLTVLARVISSSTRGGGAFCQG